MEKLHYIQQRPGGIAFSWTTCRNYSVQIVQKSNRKTNLSFSQWLRLHFGSTSTGQPWVKKKTCFFQIGKGPVFKTSIALPTGRESLLVAQVPRWIHTCTFSSYFPQNPSGRMNFFCWKWLFKGRHLCLSFPSKSESRQQRFSPYHGQHPHLIPWAASLPQVEQDLSRTGRSLSWVWGTGTIWGWMCPTARSWQCLGTTAACPHTGVRCYLSHSAVNGITLASSLKMKKKDSANTGR